MQITVQSSPVEWWILSFTHKIMSSKFLKVFLWNAFLFLVLNTIISLVSAINAGHSDMTTTMFMKPAFLALLQGLIIPVILPEMKNEKNNPLTGKCQYYMVDCLTLSFWWEVFFFPR
jgi:hypothetical protein